MRLHELFEDITPKVPTAKQVQAAKDKYEAFGYRIDQARQRTGYARGTGVVGDLQRKKGDAYSKYAELKRAYDAANPPVTEVTIDNVAGAGAVPYNQSIDYHGLRVSMKPSTFLKLAAPLGEPHNPELEQYIAQGGAIGAPFLDVTIPRGWDDGDFSEVAAIRGHEGRNRMSAILKTEGDAPIEVHLLPGSYRNRDLTPEFIKHLNTGMFAERTKNIIRGPLFNVAS